MADLNGVSTTAWELRPVSNANTAYVGVKDLWEVFPELRTHHDPQKFAEALVKAARFSRERKAFHDLRDEFNENALYTALDEFGIVLKLEDETEEETDVD